MPARKRDRAGHLQGFTQEILRMRTALAMVLMLAIVFTFVASVQAGDKVVTLKGEVMCAKCELKETPKCVTAIQVKQNGKEVTYYFKDKGSKEEYHEAVCGGGRQQATVTGTVTEKDGKKWITPTSVQYAKK
jgi:hypothetical protein